MNLNFCSIMKKLFLLTLSVAAALSLDSCFKNDTPKEDPLVGGKYIYLYTHNQEVFATDMVNIGFRLNILLTEAAKQPDGKIDNLIIKYGNNNINLTTTLFGNAIIKADETIPGDYVVTYQQSFSVYNDMSRTGSVRISTGGKLLHEIADDFSNWSIMLENPENSPLVYSYAGGSLKVTGSEPCIISGLSATEWNYSVGAFQASLYADHTSSWDTDGHVVFSGTTMDYDGVQSGKFTVNTNGSGTTLFALANMTYRGKDLVYTPKCGYSFISSGTESGGFETFIGIDPTTFPAIDVRVLWEAKDCTAGGILEYNGQVENLN